MTTDELIDGIIEREGGYTDDPDDRGGATKFGITAGELGRWRRLGRPATRAEVKKLTHRRECRRMCGKDEQGSPTLTEDQKCKVYCHKDHCSCPTSCEST